MSKQQLRYSIAGSSEHSGRYSPEHVLVDRPHDQSSRWSAVVNREREGSQSGRGWLLLELTESAIVESITFGKYHKPHPCNMKDFEVLVGVSPDHLRRVLRGALKNDSKPETFPLPTRSQTGVPFPTRYVKICSTSAHTVNFNTSIWHIALTGTADEDSIRQVQEAFDKNRETIAMRQIMKHLRQRRHISIYRQLLSRSGISLENSLVTKLYEDLVLRGDWSAAEQQLNVLAREGLFRAYIYSCVPRASWRRISATDANGDIPTRRGGHAMCMDTERGLIYLFGGYDGEKSLNDFWVYNVKQETWKEISHSVVEEKNGPGPRACHKMVCDQRSGCIYMIGRLGDGDMPPEEPPTTEQQSQNATTEGTEDGRTPVQSAWRHRQSASVSGGTASSTVAEPQAGDSSRPAQTFFSEFHRYRTRGIDQRQWELLNVDTAMAGGPPLVYDHQMVFDSASQMVYVHGGRVVDGDWSTPKYSSLYRYDLRTGKWAVLQPTMLSDAYYSQRFGHSVVHDPSLKKLFIFAGRKEDHLSDMWEYDIRNNTMTELSPNVTMQGGPEACFAQRAVIDPTAKEIYVFGGLSKKHVRGSGISVYVYRYDKQPGTWAKIPSAKKRGHRNENSPAAQSSASKDMEVDNDATAPRKQKESSKPRARCACQVVYDPSSQTFYLHGGNAGQMMQDMTSGARKDERLDDFWSMKLERPSVEEVIRRATFELRRQQYREMCGDSSPVVTLAFLQNDVSAVVNHDDPEEANVFHSLLSHLLAGPPITPLVPTEIPIIEPPRTTDSPTSTDSGSGEWTNTFRQDEDAEMDELHANSSLSETTVGVSHLGNDDPYELLLRGGKRLSDERFKQRTEVFESLLKFIDKAEVQPSESLLDVLDDV